MSLSRIEIRYFNERIKPLEDELVSIDETIKAVSDKENALISKTETLWKYRTLFNELYQLTKDTDN